MDISTALQGVSREQRNAVVEMNAALHILGFSTMLNMGTIQGRPMTDNDRADCQDMIAIYAGIYRVAKKGAK